VSCAKRLNRSICRLGYGSGGSNEAFIRLGAYWRHLANTIDRFVCGGDAAFLLNYFDHLFTQHVEFSVLCNDK